MPHEDTNENTSGSPGVARGARIERIVQGVLRGAQIVRIVPFRPDTATDDESTKAQGYGAPLRIDVRHGGRELSLVLHTATLNEFGHDRRADRAAEVLLAADTFNGIPRHVGVLDVGAYRSDGFVSLTDTGEFYLLTTHAPGSVYAEDLRRIARTGSVEARDHARHAALVTCLVGLHEPVSGGSHAAYVRSIRDTFGSGEGLLGILDAYPEDTPGAPRARLERIEERSLAARWRLKARPERLRRTHGDFHPFNVIFGDEPEPWLLDTSRGSLGDPADDVACMAINFAFFALGHPGAWRGAFAPLWHGFWSDYVARTGDAGLVQAAPLFLAWRGLVLASPAWYPELLTSDRERLLGFVERVLGDEPFTPDMAGEHFDS